jgi:uncharacterized membrane protein HdeD (DUF308 family)
MSDPVLTHEELAVWIGALQAVFGSMLVLFALRRRTETSANTARLGALLVLVGILKLLQDVVPDNVLISAALAAGLLVMAWFIRDRRKHRTTLPPSPAHNP